ncbi:hypothetical protein D3C72_1908750 [compost metagenome]
MPRPSTTSLAPAATPASTNALTFSKCGWVTSGPMSLPLSVPGPTFILAISTFRPSTTASAVASPTATTSGIAMQRSPHEP